MRTLFALGSTIIIASVVTAQSVYELPFASRDNIIELAVENTGSFQVDQVKVRIQTRPEWISFKSDEVTIEQLSGGGEKTASFVFSIDKAAQIRKDRTLTFTVSGPNGQSWTKEITISVAAPEKFELFQNYPNPFNPTTTISYQLKSDSRVSLRIYNLIGQEIMTLVDGDKTTGYHQEQWNASSVASGTYVYRLVTKDQTGKDFVAQKRMIVLK